MGNDLLTSLSFAASGMEAQSMRLRHVSENIANADTPGYHRKVISFDQAMETGLVEAGRPRLDQSDLVKIYDPGHPLADATGHRDGSNVDLVIEIADAREAQRSYEANLRMFDQTRQMTQSLFDLLRR
ncbi:flagellar basal body rod protein FlgC [Tabrizicola piscis]|jgi:flagellar basal-body rod protein FlgC|uniref:Flagellar basal body rod protein FlgB n=1 Tax=Tabrizicola piscis TaxID=2494374 RepID=A0A3S8U7A7_9RHOB|nr:flagellar basal body rod protein FlgC [Tabrizicola piscis]AZL59458.1 flagellar basal body rod protein FlgC [Tabrizicola piscis]